MSEGCPPDAVNAPYPARHGRGCRTAVAGGGYKIAKDWGSENRAHEKSYGPHPKGAAAIHAARFEGAAYESNALAKEFRAIDPAQFRSDRDGK